MRSNPWRLRLVAHVMRASFRKETNLGFFLILLSSMDIAPVKLFTYSLYVLTATLPENYHKRGPLIRQIHNSCNRK